MHDEHGRQVTARREAAVVAIAADQARDAGLALAHRPDRQVRAGRAAGEEQRAGLGAELRGMGPYPGDRIAHVGHLVGKCRVRLQPVVRAHADKTAPAGEVPDQRPRFAGLVAGVEAAAMEVQQDRRTGRPVAAVVYVQRAVRPVAVGEAAYPDHVEPAGEERGAQDAAPWPLRLTGVVQCRVRRQCAAHDDHQAGQGKQRDNGGDGAGRGAEVAVGEREHGRRDQKIPHNKRQLADHQPGEGGEGAETGPPGEGARHAPGHGRDRPQVPDRHQEPPAMRGRVHAGWPSAVGSALSPRTRPAFLGELWVLVTMCSGSMSCGTSRAPTAPLAPATELRIVSPRYSDRQDVTRRGCGRRHPEVDMAGGVSGAGPRHESADSAQRIRVNGSGPVGVPGRQPRYGWPRRGRPARG